MGWTDLIDRFKRAAGLAGGATEAIAASEKRRAFRVARHVALLGFRANGQKVNLLAIEFGATGLRVESPARLEKDEVLRLVLEQAQAHRGDVDVDDDAPRARVVWARKRKDLPTQHAGLAFVLDTPEQRRAAAHFVLDDCRVGIRNPRESRKVPRVRADMEALLMTSDGSTVKARARDIALGGVLLDSPRDFGNGTVLDVKVFLPGDAPALVCQGQVLRCVRLGPRAYELGLVFTKVADDHQERLVACLSEMLREASA